MPMGDAPRFLTRFSLPRVSQTPYRGWRDAAFLPAAGRANHQRQILRDRLAGAESAAAPRAKVCKGKPYPRMRQTRQVVHLFIGHYTRSMDSRTLRSLSSVHLFLETLLLKNEAALSQLSPYFSASTRSSQASAALRAAFREASSARRGAATKPPRIAAKSTKVVSRNFMMSTRSGAKSEPA